MKSGLIVDRVFIYSGGRFYMDWLLPTNPKSKNPVIRHWSRSCHWTFQALERVHSGKSAERRLWMSWFWTVLHLLLAVVMFVFVPELWLLNAYANLYPIIVQLYIGYRCLLRLGAIQSHML